MRTVVDPLPASANPSATIPVLEVRGLTKRYGRLTAVENVSFSVFAGQVLGLLGPNGAGKTTAICALLGLARPDAGEIRIAGIDARRQPRAALAHVGALVESPTFYPYLTGRQNLALLATLRRVPERWIDEALARVGLAAWGDRRVATYSLGMRQRLAIAAAVLHRPRLLVLDEPTNGLDPSGMVEVRELIAALARGGQTILLCSHVLAEVEQVCTHVLVLARGTVVAAGALAELLSDRSLLRLRTPALDRLQALAAQVPWLELVSVDGDMAQLRIPPEQEDAFARLLLEAGIPVLESCRERRSLEQFFLAATVGAGLQQHDVGSHRLHWRFWRTAREKGGSR
jgi:ABC-2 type transport system ATP-binding protein